MKKQEIHVQCIYQVNGMDVSEIIESSFQANLASILATPKKNVVQYFR